MTAPYTDTDDDNGGSGTGTHSTTSKTKSDNLPAESTTPAKTQAPPVVASTTQSTPGATTPSVTPGSGGSADAGAATGDGGTCAPGTMSPSGYQQNPSKAKQTGACTQSDIGYYDGLLNVKGQTYGDIEQKMRDRSTRCANCMFTNIDDTQWGPIVMEDANSGFFNWASCYALAPGGNDKCGNEVQQYYDCLNDVCAACMDDASLTDCQNKAAADTTSCGGLKFDDCADLDALNTSCATIEQALTYACSN